MDNPFNIKFPRRRTRSIDVGGIVIGGDSPISVQSMAKVPTTDIAGVLRQCEDVMLAGGDLMRVSVPDAESATALREIVRNSPLPIIADIHFNYKLALSALDAGVHKLRINPGNIGSPEHIKTIAVAAREKKVPIRIGVNAGSIPKDLEQKYGDDVSGAMVAAAEREIEILRQTAFEDIIVSLKSSSPDITLKANIEFARKFSYPLHIGITEAGFCEQGIVSSTVGLTRILSAGIGNTVRVSLTENPAEEIRIAREILRFMELREYGVRLISCPTCARCKGDVFGVARAVWEQVKNISVPISVAVMGCEVNGPGEAKHATIGVAMGKNDALLFADGKPVQKVKKENIVQELMAKIMYIASNYLNHKDF